MCKAYSTLSFIIALQSLYINKWKVLTHNTFHLNYLEIIFAIKLPLQQPEWRLTKTDYQRVTEFL